MRQLLTPEGRDVLRYLLGEQNRWMVGEKGFLDIEGDPFSDETAFKIAFKLSADAPLMGTLPSAKKAILVVDDTPGVAKDIEVEMARRDIEAVVIRAESSLQARELFNRYKDAICLVIMDNSLVTYGASCDTTTLIQEMKDAPVVGWSGTDNHLHLLKEAGCVAAFFKGCEMGLLMDRVLHHARCETSTELIPSP